MFLKVRYLFCSYIICRHFLCYDVAMKKTWDVIVIGGGPAGMMSAGAAAARGLSVLLLEKNSILGKKLRITGGGRCNITNATFKNRELLEKYTNASPFLFSPFSKHAVKETLDFFTRLELLTKTEAEKRVFPVSEKAEDVANTLVEYLADQKVTVVANCQVKSMSTKDSKIALLKTSTGTYEAKSYILAAGGNSRPETGSNGEGYKLLEGLGLKVIHPEPSLVPITLNEPGLKKLSGVSIPDTTISIYQDELLVKKARGKILFTHNGLSGPGILNLSSYIGEGLKHGPIILKLNLTPDYTDEKLSTWLKETLVEEANKKIKNIFTEILLSSMAEAVLGKCQIDPDRKCNTITRNERHLLITTIRGFSVKVKGLLGPDKAVVASGGLDLTELDFTNMSVKKMPNLYVVGDLLNINRPSGGYSLQLCWTTGFVAGSSLLSE